MKAAKKSDPESQTYTWSGTHSENCSITFLLRVYKDSPSVVEYALNFLAAHKMLESKEGESLVVAGAMVDQAVLHARMPLDAPVVEMGARRVYAVLPACLALRAKSFVSGERGRRSSRV